MKSIQILLLSIVALYSYEINAHLPAAAAAGAGAEAVAAAITSQGIIEAIDLGDYDMFYTWIDNNPKKEDALTVLDLLLTPSYRPPQAVALAVPLAKKLIKNGENSQVHKLINKKLKGIEKTKQMESKLAGDIYFAPRPTSLEEMKKIQQEIESLTKS